MKRLTLIVALVLALVGSTPAGAASLDLPSPFAEVAATSKMPLPEPALTPKFYPTRCWGKATERPGCTILWFPTKYGTRPMDLYVDQAEVEAGNSGLLFHELGHVLINTYYSAEDKAQARASWRQPTGEWWQELEAQAYSYCAALYEPSSVPDGRMIELFDGEYPLSSIGEACARQRELVAPGRAPFTEAEYWAPIVAAEQARHPSEAIVRTQRQRARCVKRRRGRKARSFRVCMMSVSATHSKQRRFK